jgi:hypothetical protein
MATTTDDDIDDDVMDDDDDDDDDLDDNNSTKPKKLLSVNVSNQKYRSDVYCDGSLDLTNTVKVPDSVSRSVDGMGSVRAAVAQTATITSTTTSTVSASSLELELKKNARDKANLVSSSSSSSARWTFQKDAIPVVLGLVSQKGNDDDDDEEGDDDENNTGKRGNTNSKGGSGVAENVDMEEFVIPRSIREIYMISNRNRRNKKAGSPTPERGVTPTNEKERLALAQAEAFLESRGDAVARYFLDDNSTSSGKRQKQTTNKSSSGRESEETVPYDSSIDVASKDDDFKFMKEIGWIPKHNESTTVEEFLNQGSLFAGTSSGRNRGGSSSSSVGHIATLPPGQQQQLPRSDAGVTEDQSTSALRSSSPSMAGGTHPTGGQEFWNAGQGNNPFFTGAAAQGGGPLQQQRNLGGSKFGPPTGTTNNTSGTAGAGSKNKPSGNNARNTGSNSSNNSSRQQERPDRKESRTHAYRKR